MRVPIRKGSGPLAPSQDPKMTQAKYEELKNKLDFWLRVKRPRDAAEVQRLALMGDFSENVGYQMAKGKLRSLNQRIIELEKLLNRAEIIEKNKNTDKVEVGNVITIAELNNAKNERSYTILGSSESEPENGIISHVSPLGSQLLNKMLGDEIVIKIKGENKIFKIIKIA